jgi:hypothetical protein
MILFEYRYVGTLANNADQVTNNIIATDKFLEKLTRCILLLTSNYQPSECLHSYGVQQYVDNTN